LTRYAMEFLLRARAAGAAVPEAAIADGLKALGGATGNEEDTPAGLADQAYRLYVLAYAGQGRPGAARVLAQQTDKLPTPLAKAQLGAALALAHDSPRAVAAGLRGPDLQATTLSTQEQAWTATAAAVLGRDGRPARIALNGRELPVAPVVTVALDGPA